MNDDARCGSKPARWRCKVFFAKEWMRHEIPEEPARRGSHTSASLCLDGPTKKYGCIIPRTKTHAHEMQEKAGSISNPHFTAQALRSKAAAYATLARLSTRIT